MKGRRESVDDDPFQSITFYLNFHCSLMETRGSGVSPWCMERGDSLSISS